MAGSIFGTTFQITTWGESHGSATGAVINGCPAGLPLSTTDIQFHLDRRKPGTNPYASSRKESDKVELLSGIFKGKTTGTPISLLIKNEHQLSKDYDALSQLYRPGHADYTYDCKYGFRDYLGGGRSSGRETASRVAAGAVALKLLEILGIKFTTFTKSLGPITVAESEYDYTIIPTTPLLMPNHQACEHAKLFLDACIENQDSCGGIIECRIQGIPPGVGEPVFDKLDANLAKAMMSIGGVKGFEIGDGFDCANTTGSKHNDAFYYDGNCIKKSTNHAGGILGGISDGSEIVFRTAIKPTPSIAHTQSTVTTNGEPISLSILGRHDPVIVPRAVVVVEAMAALTIADLLLSNMTSRLDSVQHFYL